MTPVTPEGYYIFDPDDPFEMQTGPFYSPTGQEPIGFAFRAERRHCNRSGIVHGGCLMTMADLTLCVTAREGTDDTGVVTVSMTSDFVTGGKIGDWIVSSAEVIKRTNSLVFVRGQVTANGTTLVNVSAVVKRIKPKR